MDGCNSHGGSTAEDVSSYCESHADLPDKSESDLRNLSVDDLGSGLTEYLKIQNDQNCTRRFTTAPRNNNAICLVKEDEYSDSHGTKLQNSACKRLEKCATFPCSSKAAVSAGSMDVEGKREVDLTAEVLTQNGHTNSVNRPYLHHSISLPTSLKLVSAMKGSREKRGKPAQKLSVTWAPDVYDPTPTAVSHVPSNKPQRRRSEGKKNGKNKQKGGGKSSRGSKGKDKMQARKSGRHSNRCNSSLDDHRVVYSGESLASVASFDVDSLDPFCGSSFLKKSVTELYFPVAEAT